MQKDKPKIYYRKNCVESQRVLDYLRVRAVGHDQVLVEDGNEAFQELDRLTGQTGTPTLIFHGEILRNLDIPKLNSFLDRFKLGTRPGKG